MEIEEALMAKEIHLQDQEADESKLCIVCQDALKVMVAIPCGHLSMCEACESNIRSRTGRCPICNKNYNQRMKVPNWM